MQIDVRLMGGFAMCIDGVPLPVGRWRRHHAAALVKLLALTSGRRLHREQVIDVLWPGLLVDEALPRLHKAAYFARQALARPDAVVLRDAMVALFPDAVVTDDVSLFVRAAEEALGRAEAARRAACEAVLEQCGGELLPDDPYEPWTEEPRRRVRSCRLRLLRCAERWEDVLGLEPADEEAHVELIRAAVVAGDRADALRRYDRMDRLLREELGVGPSPIALALRERAALIAGVADPTATSPAMAPATPGWSTPVAHRLLERDTELEVLAGAADRAGRDGRGGVMVVVGEAGSGKTALVSAFLERLDGFDVLVGACDDLLASRTLGPLRDIADAIPEVDAAFHEGHETVYGAMLRLLAARPTVLVIEDVQWADDATIDVLRYLCRRMAGVPSILAMTVRDDDFAAAHPLRRVLAGLGGSSVVRIELQPLTVSAVAALAGDDVAAEIHAVTKGNAFFVTEVLAEAGAGVPVTVRDAVLARVARLSPLARSFVELLSVVPSRGERWLAEYIAGGDITAIVEAERSGMLVGGPEHVGFRHELARRAVEASMTAVERTEANRKVVDALLNRGDVEPSRLVHHAVHGARIDVLVGIGPLAAAEAARMGAHRQCAETLRLVLEHRRELDQRTTAELMARRAYSLYVVNLFEASYQSAAEGVAVAEDAADTVVLADVLAVYTKAAFWARGPIRARAAAARAVELLEAAGDDARLAGALTDLARAHSNLGTVGIVAEPSVEALRFAQRALRIAERLGRDDLSGQALCYVGSSRLALDDPRGTGDLERAVALTSTDPRRELRVRGHVNAAGSAYRAGRFDEVERHIAAGLRVAGDGEFFAGEYRLRLTGAAAMASRGAWDDAIAALEALLATDGEPGMMRPLAQGLLARLLARRGDQRASHVLADALSDPVGGADIYVAGPLGAAQLELAWLLGTPDELPTMAAPVLDLAERAGHRTSQAELCRYLQRAGHTVAVARDPPGPWRPALAGRWQEAAAAWDRLGERYEAALERAGARNDVDARSAGLDALHQLGAVATIAVLDP